MCRRFDSTPAHQQTQSNSVVFDRAIALSRFSVAIRWPLRSKRFVESSRRVARGNTRPRAACGDLRAFLPPLSACDGAMPVRARPPSEPFWIAGFGTSPRVAWAGRMIGRWRMRDGAARFLDELASGRGSAWQIENNQQREQREASQVTDLARLTKVGPAS